MEDMGTKAGWGLADVLGVLEVLIPLSFSVKSGAKSLTMSEFGRGVLEVSEERKCELVP